MRDSGIEVRAVFFSVYLLRHPTCCYVEELRKKSYVRDL